MLKLDALIWRLYRLDCSDASGCRNL